MNATQIKTKTLSVYIFMDDSEKLTSKENVSVYAGIVFSDKSEKDKFNRKYKKIISEIKCLYCSENSDDCTGVFCPEIKNHNIKNSHKRRLVNLCKQHCTYAVIINNKKVYPNILATKASKGRYTDYAQKMIIKKIVTHYINEGIINPMEDLNLIIRIDQQSTKSNGYYSLKESISEELSHGIMNYNYGIMHRPIIFGNLNVDVEYMDSKKVYSIQASDIIAGSVRNIVLHYSKDVKELNERLNSILTIKMFLP